MQQTYYSKDRILLTFSLTEHLLSKKSPERREHKSRTIQQFRIRYSIFRNSQGGRGNFTYLPEGKTLFAPKLFVGCQIKQF